MQEAQRVLPVWRCVWHANTVDRTNSWLWGAQQSELQLLPALKTYSLVSYPFLCLLHHPSPPETNTLYPCHRPLLHLSHWCIGSLQKVTTQGLLTPGFRDCLAHYHLLASCRGLAVYTESAKTPSVILTDWMENSGSVALARSHASGLRLVFMWLVRMPVLSPINHGPLSRAMPSTAGDNIDSEWCCCRLSNYTQHGKRSLEAWWWFGSQPYRRFCCFIFDPHILFWVPLYGTTLLYGLYL